MFSYVVPAFDQLPAPLEFIVAEPVSLFPRWWPKLLEMEAFEETVLVRLGANELEATE